MSDRSRKPVISPTRRAETRAFLTAPLVAPAPAVIFSYCTTTEFSGWIAIVGVILAYILTGAVAFPLYRILRITLRPTLPACALVGTMIGLIPAAPAMLTGGGDFIPRDDTQLLATLSAVCGLIGGVTFWAILALDSASRQA